MAGRPALRAQAALKAVPRARYLPAEIRSRAHLDEALPIGWGSTNSQPWTVAYMLRLLDPRPGMTVLDVGAGSGWTTDLLAWLVGAEGRVIGTEVVPSSCLVAARRCGRRTPRSGLPSRAIWGCRRRRRSTGSWSRRIRGRLPAELVAQLAPAGRMVIPVASRPDADRQRSG